MSDFNKYINVIDANSPEKGEFTNLNYVVGRLLNIGLGVGLVLSVIAIILSGIKFMSSKGDIKAIGDAKNALTWSILALVLILGAFTIVNLLVDITGLNTPGDLYTYE